MNTRTPAGRGLVTLAILDFGEAAFLALVILAGMMQML
jgi:hypothetical protein